MCTSEKQKGLETNFTRWKFKSDFSPRTDFPKRLSFSQFSVLMSTNCEKDSLLLGQSVLGKRPLLNFKWVKFLPFTNGAYKALCIYRGVTCSLRWSCRNRGLYILGNYCNGPPSGLYFQVTYLKKIFGFRRYKYTLQPGVEELIQQYWTK